MIRKKKEQKNEKGEKLDKKSAYAIDRTAAYERAALVDAFHEKASKIYKSGKTAVCSELVRIFKPLVYNESIRRDSYDNFTWNVNKAIGVAGAAAGVAYGIANHDDIAARHITDSQFLDFFVHMPFVSEAILGVGGNWISRYVHAKANVAMRNNEIPTLADAVFGSRSGRKDGFKGIIPSLMDKAEKYLALHAPDNYRRVMNDARETAEYIVDKREYKQKKQDLKEREEKIRNSVVVMSNKETENIEAEKEQLKKERPKRPSIVKRMLMRRKSNPRE